MGQARTVIMTGTHLAVTSHHLRLACGKCKLFLLKRVSGSRQSHSPIHVIKVDRLEVRRRQPITHVRRYGNAELSVISGMSGRRDAGVLAAIEA